MNIYFESFLITLFLSTLFSMGGAGGAAALIPILNFLGFSFPLSKAAGLFVNVTATSVSTLLNLKHKLLDLKITIPLLISLTIFLPIGAYFSQYLNEKTMKWMLALFLIFSSYMLIFGKKQSKFNLQNRLLLFLIGAVVGIFSGIIGISGGNIIAAILILLGYDPKKTAAVISSIIPISSFAGFLTYANMIKIDYKLILCTALAALIGGYIGNNLMYFKLKSSQIKKIIGILLFLIALKLILTLIK
jgi:uncharacterized membrane protein YfcA